MKLKNIFYINKKPNILLIIFSIFISIMLLGFILIMSIVYLYQDEIHYSDRFNEQLRNNKYLKENIENYFFYDYEGIDRMENGNQIYKVIQISLGGAKYTIVDVWFKTKEYNWQFDSVKIVRPPGEYARNVECLKYKFKNR